MKNLTDFDKGKLPPQALDAEVLILAFLSTQNELLDEAMPLLKPDYFYKESHQKIFSAIQHLYQTKNTVDIITIANRLKKTGDLDLVGGTFYLSNLTERTGAANNLETHIRILTEKFLKREIIRVAYEMAGKCFDDTTDVFDNISELDSFTSSLNQHVIGKEYEINYSKLIDDTYNEIISTTNGSFNGINTGCMRLNAITGGWNAPDLILLCARPGMGKSTRAINFMKDAVKQGKKCALFSLEMSNMQIIKKQLIDWSDTYANKILNSELSDFDKQKLRNAKEELKNYSIYLNEKPAISPNYIRQVCRERKKKYGLDLVIIDYLQLMKPSQNIRGRNREQEIGEISSALKSLCKEINIPIIALCQLNRDLEKRTDKRPIKSDLRDSGQLEQDADIILGLYRPSQYFKPGDDPEYKNVADPDVFKRISEIHVLKNRHGKSEVYFEEKFYGELSRFEPLN